MPITTAWTSPVALDLGVGSVLPEAVWDNLVSNELYLWDVTKNYGAGSGVGLNVLSLLVGTADTNLYRGGPNQLKTDDDLYAVGDVLANYGGTDQIWLANNAGVPTIYLGNALDTDLLRVAAGTLGTNSLLRVTRSSAPAAALATRTASDANTRLTISADGGMSWGDGAVAADTTLYRGGPNILKTDDAFQALGDVTAPNLPVRIGRVTPSGVTTVTFSSIPATYRHLVIRGVVRSSLGANGDELRLRVNGSASAIYSWDQLILANTTVTGTNTNGDTSFLLGAGVPAANWNANAFATVLVNLHEYAFGGWKPVVTEMAGIDPAGLTNKARVQSGGLIETTTAISSVTLVLNAGTFVAGSSFDLWGFP